MEPAESCDQRGGRPASPAPCSLHRSCFPPMHNQPRLLKNSAAVGRQGRHFILFPLDGQRWLDNDSDRDGGNIRDGANDSLSINSHNGDNDCDNRDNDSVSNNSHNGDTDGDNDGDMDNSQDGDSVSNNIINRDNDSDNDF